MFDVVAPPKLNVKVPPVGEPLNVIVCTALVLPTVLRSNVPSFTLVAPLYVLFTLLPITRVPGPSLVRLVVPVIWALTLRPGVVPLSTDVKLRLAAPSATTPLITPLLVPAANPVTSPPKVSVLLPVNTVPPRRSRLAIAWPAVVPGFDKSSVPPALT